MCVQSLAIDPRSYSSPLFSPSSLLPFLYSHHETHFFPLLATRTMKKIIFGKKPEFQSLPSHSCLFNMNLSFKKFFFLHFTLKLQKNDMFASNCTRLNILMQPSFLFSTFFFSTPGRVLVRAPGFVCSLIIRHSFSNEIFVDCNVYQSIRFICYFAPVKMQNAWKTCRWFYSTIIRKSNGSMWSTEWMNI